ncbi:hypothetical protein M1397_04100 [Candidatus Marsarchaeota archaeon]|nr:hypothetical protein [Candidatus Marsarchaeota archaeon]
MLLSIFILVSSIAFGIALVSRMEFADNILLRLSIGMPVGIAVYSALSFLFDYVNGMVLGSFLFVTALLLLALAALLIVQATGRKPTMKSLKKQMTGKGFGIPLSLVMVLLLFYIAIEPIFAVSVFYSHGTLYCEGPGCSDNIFHLSLGNSVLYSRFPPKVFLEYGVINDFSFMYDFFDSIMLKYGLGLNGALIIPEGLMVFSFVCLSMLIAYRITGSKLKTIFSLIIFWFGGVGFMQALDYPFVKILSPIFQPIHLLVPPQSGHGIVAAINAVTWVITDYITPWTSIINTMLVAQRDFVLGLPIGLAIIYMLYIFAIGKRQPSKKEAAFLGLCFGLLPLIHPLTLISVAVIGAFALIFYMVTARRKFSSLIRAAIVVAVAAAIAIPEVLFIDLQQRGGNWFYTIYGTFVIYAHNLFTTLIFSFGNVVFFWLEVAGIPVVIGMLGLLYANKKERLLFIPFLALWVIITLIAITPNPADSNEIFLYVFFMLAVLSAEFLYKLWKDCRWYGKSIAIVLIVLICINIPFVMYHDDFHNIQLTESNAELRAAAFILNNTPGNAVFAVSDYNTFDPVVPSLAERQTLISIYFYVRGFTSAPQSQLIQANSDIVDNGSCAAVSEYNVFYVYLRGGNAASRAPFENQNFKEIYNSYDNAINGNITIYKTNCS